MTLDDIKEDELRWMLTATKERIYKHFAQWVVNSDNHSHRYIFDSKPDNRALLIATIDTIREPDISLTENEGLLWRAPTIHHRLGCYLALRLAVKGGFDVLLVDKRFGYFGTTASFFKTEKKYNYVVELGRSGLTPSVDGCDNKGLVRALEKSGFNVDKYSCFCNARDLTLPGDPAYFVLGLGYEDPYTISAHVDLEDAVTCMQGLVVFDTLYGKHHFKREAKHYGYRSGWSRSAPNNNKVSSRTTVHSYKAKPKDYSVMSCKCGAFYCAHELKEDKKCKVCGKFTSNENEKVMEVKNVE